MKGWRGGGGGGEGGRIPFRHCVQGKRENPRAKDRNQVKQLVTSNERFVC